MTIHLSCYILWFLKRKKTRQNHLKLRFLVHKISQWSTHNISLSEANMDDMHLFLILYNTDSPEKQINGKEKIAVYSMASLLSFNLIGSKDSGKTVWVLESRFSGYFWKVDFLASFGPSSRGLYLISPIAPAHNNFVIFARKSAMPCS